MGDNKGAELRELARIRHARNRQPPAPAGRSVQERSWRQQAEQEEEMMRQALEDSERQYREEQQQRAAQAEQQRRQREVEEQQNAERRERERLVQLEQQRLRIQQIVQADRQAAADAEREWVANQNEADRRPRVVHWLHRFRRAVLQPAAAAAQQSAPAPAPHPMACGICMENVPALVPVGIEVERGHYFNKRCCAHSFCAGCLRQHVDTAISNSLQVIRCPEANCNYALYPDDIARLGDPAAVAQLAELRNQDYGARLQEIESGREDPDVARYVADHARPCPQCRVLIERAQGCDRMRCLCGASFCWRCGLDRCRCVALDVRDMDVQAFMADGGVEAADNEVLARWFRPPWFQERRRQAREQAMQTRERELEAREAQLQRGLADLQRREQELLAGQRALDNELRRRQRQFAGLKQVHDALQEQRRINLTNIGITCEEDAYDDF